ncbi:hypothetical protein ACFTAO_06585 [Paenibacillus rhizoplanae]
MTQSGIIIFTLPRQLAEHFGTNGWLFLVPCFVISSLNIYLISLVYHMGKGRSIFLILEQSISKVLLYPLYIGLASVWLIFGCMIGKKIRAALSNDLFSDDQFNGLQAGHRPAGFIAAYERDLYHFQSYNNVFFWVTLWMYLLLLAFIPNFHWVRLTPLFSRKVTIWCGGTGYLYSVPRV